MNTDTAKAEAAGIFIQKGAEMTEVFFERTLDEVTKAEIGYLFDQKVVFQSGSGQGQMSFKQSTDEAKLINTEIDQFVTDDEFKQSAKVALSAESETDTPVIKLFNNLISVAIARRASDIHVDVENSSLFIRMRFDGILVTYAELDLRIASMLVARIKLLSGMDITERRKPQDGRFSVVHRGKNVDIRCASMPVSLGERVALRVFNQDPNSFLLEKIGLEETHVHALSQALSKQSGLLVVCGPTGSGKTTTIYSILRKLRGRGLNIMTIEDPIEMDLDETVQTQVDENVDYTFPLGLKSLLRNDPDVILVGEIRDEDTAHIAVRAAMTGHLVVTSVHANSPIGGIKRLLNFGVDSSLLSDCLIGVFSQRLIRVYCEGCIKVSTRCEAHHQSLPSKFDGCEKCFGTGFSYRRPVMSHLLMSTDNRQTLDSGATDLDFEDTISKEGMEMHDRGLTPFFEVFKLQSN